VNFTEQMQQFEDQAFRRHSRKLEEADREEEVTRQTVCGLCGEYVVDCTCTKLPEDYSGETVCEECKFKSSCDGLKGMFLV
jgi:hypothetical protein